MGFRARTWPIRTSKNSFQSSRLGWSLNDGGAAVKSTSTRVAAWKSSWAERIAEASAG